jgi:hypothetical protein
MNNGFQMRFFGGQNRKALPQIKPHLVTKDRQSAGSGAVIALHAVV